MLIFGVLHFGDHNLHGGVGVFQSDDAYRELGKTTRDAFNRSDLAGTIHSLDQGFGGHMYSLKNLFKDEQRKVLGEVLQSTVEHSSAVYRQMYEEQAPLLRFLSDCGISDSNRSEGHGGNRFERFATGGACVAGAGPACDSKPAGGDPDRSNSFGSD